MNDKELQERFRMALEAILELEGYYSIQVAQKIAQRAIQSDTDTDKVEDIY